MGKKKKKKDFKNDPAAILEKGEKFFKKGTIPWPRKNLKSWERRLKKTTF